MSAAAMIAVTGLALWLGPSVWAVFVLVVFGATLWELSALCDQHVGPVTRIILASIPLAVALAGALAGHGAASPALWALSVSAPLVAGLPILQASRAIWVAYGGLLAVASMALGLGYAMFGVWALVILVALVAISDSAGYFVGRFVGGPKFWPQVSPKKTWSGTIAGWAGAAVFAGLVLPGSGLSAGSAALFGVLVAFSAQMGDIAESAIKRRAGVKDASALIPGHGGVLDRIDGLVAAACVAGIVAALYGG